MKYEGVCYDTGAWGGDLTGHLFGQFPDGWKVVASHISSGVDWASRDIAQHYEDREEATEADTYEWVGSLHVDAIFERYGHLKVKP